MKRTWLGIGEKTGGVLFVVGLEDTWGGIFNLSNPSSRAQFGLANARVGLGLGGGAGIVAMCVFNCLNINQLHGTESSDWGVNISLGAKWDKVVKALKNYKFFTSVVKIGSKLKIHDPKDLESIRNSLHYIYNEYGVATAAGSSPTVICFDTPAGIGLEVSATYSFGGKIEIM
ncbi:MAG TPA: hypothetical protein VMM38_16275 [Aridibacter sp.]|nr:hypothetical protein [Aridibacter sp.]